MSDKNLWDYHQKENRMHLTASYPRQNKLSKIINQFLKPEMSILENGFWDGYLLNKLSILGFNAIGQDISEQNIKITGKQWNNDRLKLLLWDVSWKILVNNDSVDGYIASEVLEHMSDEELDFHIKEIYRVLKKWGYGFLTFPAKENLKTNECACPKCWEIFHKRWHKQYRDEKKVHYKFKAFKILTIKTFVSRVQWETIFDSLMWYLKVIWSHILDINKSYLVIIKK